MNSETDEVLKYLCIQCLYCRRVFQIFVSVKVFINTAIGKKNSVIESKIVSLRFTGYGTILGGVPHTAEVGNCSIFVAENVNVVHISADSDTKIVNKTEISISESRKTEIVNIIVADIGNYRS